MNSHSIKKAFKTFDTFRISPAVKAPILGEACIRVRIKYFYSFMTFGPY